MVRVDHISKIYGTQKAVDDISFSADKGQIIGLLGPNGAGKSTTMKMITGYLLANEGSISVCGLDVVQNPREVKNKIGYLPEHNPLYLDMFVYEYLEFAGSLYTISTQRRKSKIEELIEKTGLTSERKKKIGQLSKGYRQRVGLAQALIHDPDVLILDEPTTGLDPNQIVEIRRLIQEVGQSKTVILSTHILQEVSAICTRAVIINRGKIVADNDIGELADLAPVRRQLVLRFKDKPEVEWIQRLPGIRSVNREGEKEFLVDVLDHYEDDIQSLIFKEAAARNQVLFEMDWQESSLESVFQKLTK